MHRNTFINAPACLARTLQFKGRPELFFAGQITGVEGYVESAACGFLAGIFAARFRRGGRFPCRRRPPPSAPCSPTWPTPARRTFSR